MLMKHFVMKDMGPLLYLLGISCIQGEPCIGLTQTTYIEKLIDKLTYRCKAYSAPSDQSVILMKDDTR